MGLAITTSKFFVLHSKASAKQSFKADGFAAAQLQR
jgi:hypothetical protein